MLIVYILVISRSGFQGRTLVLIVSVPDQCYYFTFSKTDPIRCISYDNWGKFLSSKKLIRGSH